MADREDYAAEDLVSQSRSLLEELDGVEGLATGAGGELAVRAEDESRHEEIESIQRSLGLAVDGRFDFETAEDEMSCRADFHPPKEGGKPVDLEALQDALGKRGVTFGIDWNVVEQAVLRCNTEREELSGVLIARGAVPVDEVPEHLEMELSVLSPPPEKSEAVRIDHRERSAFRMVKKGQTLARLVAKQQGAPGSTVTGRYIATKVRRAASLRSGENTEPASDAVIASCDGRLIHTDRSFRVSRVLEVAGDLDYHTGNVDFGGDVTVAGMVKDGFTVKCVGSLMCERSVGAAEVIGGGDVIIRSGFIGRNRGRVKAGGSFGAKFVENGYVEARGPIRLEVGAMNSVLNTLGLLETGAKAIVVGGKICAADGIDVMHLGSRMGVRTEVYCGTNYAVTQKLEWVRDNLMKIARKVRDVQRMRAAGRGDQVALAALEEQLRAAVTKMNQTSIALIPLLDKNDNAHVVARGTVYPGVYIEICHIPFIVQREMTRVRFSLDKAQGKIKAERLLR